MRPLLVRLTVYLEFENTARLQATVYLANVIFDHVPTRNVLKNDEGERKIDDAIREPGEITALISCKRKRSSDPIDSVAPGRSSPR